MAGLWDSLELFAPAADPNDPASMAKAKAWQDKYFGMTPAGVEQTRRPTSFNTGNPGGMIDPEALRVLAQGGPYDLDATPQRDCGAVAGQPGRSTRNIVILSWRAARHGAGPEPVCIRIARHGMGELRTNGRRAEPGVLAGK